MIRPPNRSSSLRLFRWPVLGLLLFILRSEASAEADFRPQFTPVVPGIDYAHLQITNVPWSIHVARLDRSHKEYGVVTTLAKGTVQGLGTVVSQLKQLPERDGQPVAAVNGDFFVIKTGPYQGDPEGLQIVDGEYVSAPARGSFWVDGGQFHIGRVNSEMAVTWPTGAKTPLAFNEAPKPDKVTLFTPTLGASTRATNTVELVLEKADHAAWNPFQPGQTYRARVRAINTCGNTTLQPDIAVLALGSRLTNLISTAKPGMELKISTATSPNLAHTTAAIGGAPILLLAGKEESWTGAKGTNSLAATRHPRTAIGFNSQYLFLVEVDGRQKGLSLGMTFPEMARLMRDLGCTDAMNLDGGGSSTFWMNGKVLNSPSDKHERTVANAVVIVRH
jgi:hypothetical protein